MIWLRILILFGVPLGQILLVESMHPALWAITFPVAWLAWMLVMAHLIACLPTTQQRS
jgi:hypothetical protein